MTYWSSKSSIATEAGHVDDFWSNSQMLSRLAAIATHSTGETA